MRCNETAAVTGVAGGVFENAAAVVVVAVAEPCACGCFIIELVSYRLIFEVLTGSSAWRLLVTRTEGVQVHEVEAWAEVCCEQMTRHAACWTG